MPTEDGRSVPRLYKLAYLEVALKEISRNASFERIRQALLQSAELAGEEQMVPGVVSRLHDSYTFWSPTQEALSELMRLGFVVQAQVPSSRQHVDSHRATTYELTQPGQSAVQALLQGGPKSRADFLDMLGVALLAGHLGFMGLLTTASRHPLCIPEYTIERISGLIGSGSGIQLLAEDAVSRLVAHWPEDIAPPNAAALASVLNAALERRFPSGSGRRPTQKDILDTIDDAVLSFASRALGVWLDAISFNVCMSWASQLAILEETRYVDGWPGRTIWATATVSDGHIARRGFAEVTDELIEDIWDGFLKVAESAPDSRASGYLPIHRVRAQAAFAARVNLRLVDFVLARLLSGELEAPYEVHVALGRGTPPPRSEPIFTQGGRRFFDIMLRPKSGSGGLT